MRSASDALMVRVITAPFELEDRLQPELRYGCARYNQRNPQHRWKVDVRASSAANP